MHSHSETILLNDPNLEVYAGNLSEISEIRLLSMQCSRVLIELRILIRMQAEYEIK